MGNVKKCPGCGAAVDLDSGHTEFPPPGESGELENPTDDTVPDDDVPDDDVPPPGRTRNRFFLED